MTDDEDEEPIDPRNVQITVPRPLSFLPLLTALLLIGVVIGWIVR